MLVEQAEYDVCRVLSCSKSVVEEMLGISGKCIHEYMYTRARAPITSVGRELSPSCGKPIHFLWIMTWRSFSNSSRTKKLKEIA